MLVALATIFALILPALTLDKETAEAEAVSVAENESGARVLAVEEDDIPLNEKAAVSYTLYLDGQPVTDPNLKWTEGRLQLDISISQISTDNLQVDTWYTLDVGTEFSKFFSDISGTIVGYESFTDELAEWQYDTGTGILKVKFLNTQAGNYWVKDATAKAKISIIGTLDIQTIGHDTTITIGDTEFNFTPEPGGETNNVQVNKSRASEELREENGQLIQSFYTEFKGVGVNPDAVLEDSMGSNLTLVEDSIRVYADRDQTTLYPSDAYSIRRTSTGFTIDFPNFDSNTCYVFYDTIVNPAAMNLSDTTHYSIRNTATGRSNGNSDYSYAYAKIEVKDWADKSGTFFPKGSEVSDAPEAVQEFLQDGSAVRWVIDINTKAPQRDVGGMTFTDNLNNISSYDHPTTYIDGSVQFLVRDFDSDGDWTLYNADAQSALNDQLKNENRFSYTFEVGSTRSYRIVIWTHTDGFEALRNEIDWNGGYEYADVDPTQIYNYDVLTKLVKITDADRYVGSTNGKTTEVTWKLRVDGSKYGIENAKIVDSIPAGMRYVEGSAAIVEAESYDGCNPNSLGVEVIDQNTSQSVTFSLGDIPSRDTDDSYSDDYAGIVTITFKTKIVGNPDSDTTYNNSANIYSGDAYLNYSSASYRYQPSNVISKSGQASQRSTGNSINYYEYDENGYYYLESQSGYYYDNYIYGYDYSQLSWTITFREKIPQDASTVVLEDIIGEGQRANESRPASLVLKINNNYSQSTVTINDGGTTVINRVTYDSSDFFTVSYQTDEMTGQQKMVVTLQPKAIEYMKQYGSSQFSFFTTITDKVAVNESLSKTYYNTASLLIDGENAGDANAEVPVTVTQSDILSKSGRRVMYHDYYSAGEDTPTDVEFYTIRVNSKAVKLSDNGVLTLTDTFGSNLQLLPSTIRVYKVDPNEGSSDARLQELDIGQFQLQTFSNPDKFVMQLPDETALLITYQAKLIAPEGGGEIYQGDPRYSNTAKLNSYVTEYDQISGVITDSSSSASGTVLNVTIKKVDQDMTSRGLNDATFRIESVKLFSEQSLLNNYYDNSSTLKADQYGDEFDSSRALDTNLITASTLYGPGYTPSQVVYQYGLYRITETQAPKYRPGGAILDENYITDDAPHYVLFLPPISENDWYSHYLNNLSSVIVDGQEYPLTVYHQKDSSMELTNQKLPAVSLSKTVVEAPADFDLNTAFTFKLTLKDASGSPVSGTYQYSIGDQQKSIEFVRGVAQVELKHGDQIRIVNLPLGGTLTVEELDAKAVTSQIVIGAQQTEAAGKVDVSLDSDAYVSFTNDVSVKTVTLKLLKTDLNGTPLSNASFALYPEDQIVNGEPVDGAQPYERMTDSNGTASFADLEPGYYYLVETKAPLGYVEINMVKIKLENGNIEAAPYVCSVDADDSTVLHITVPNNDGHQLPETGGVGSAPFMIGGSALILFAAMAFVFTRKRRNHA